jgi:hypothetical protein
LARSRPAWSFHPYKDVEKKRASPTNTESFLDVTGSSRLWILEVGARYKAAGTKSAETVQDEQMHYLVDALATNSLNARIDGLYYYAYWESNGGAKYDSGLVDAGGTDVKQRGARPACNTFKCKTAPSPSC